MQQLDHLRFTNWTARIKQRWIGIFSGQADGDDLAEETALFRNAWEEIRESVATRPGNENLPPFEEIEPRLLGAMRATPPAWEVNSRDAAARWDHSNWSHALSHILVGGENLGRGFTVEGLTVSYMPRGSGQRQIDTIEQRGRFFGYKGPYLGFCEVFLAPDVREMYTEYLNHEEFLISRLRELAVDPSASMTEWRRAMILASSVQPTRPNVLPRGLYRQLQLKEWTSHAYPLSQPSEDAFAANRHVVDEFVGSLAFTDDVGDPGRTAEQIHGVASGIPLTDVIGNLLIPLRNPDPDAFQFSGLELVLGYYLNGHPDATVSIYRMSYHAQPRASGATRYRSTGAGDRINPFQGANPPAYGGDQTIHSDDISIQIHDIDVRQGTQVVRANVPMLAVWLPQPVRQGVLMET